MHGSTLGRSTLDPSSTVRSNGVTKPEAHTLLRDRLRSIPFRLWLFLQVTSIIITGKGEKRKRVREEKFKRRGINIGDDGLDRVKIQIKFTARVLRRS